MTRTKGTDGAVTRTGKCTQTISIQSHPETKLRKSGVNGTRRTKIQSLMLTFNQTSMPKMRKTIKDKMVSKVTSIAINTSSTPHTDRQTCQTNGQLLRTFTSDCLSATSSPIRQACLPLSFCLLECSVEFCARQEFLSLSSNGFKISSLLRSLEPLPMQSLS